MPRVSQRSADRRSVRSREPQRLTDAPGYDAEGAYSPDGQHIVFASNREAYARALSARGERNASRPTSSISATSTP